MNMVLNGVIKQKRIQGWAQWGGGGSRIFDFPFPFLSFFTKILKSMRGAPPPPLNEVK